MRLDNFWLWIAHHLPRRLQMWTVVNAHAEYTTKHPKAEVSTVTAFDLQDLYL